MTLQASLLPLFVLVALTFGLMIWMGVIRVGAVRRREVHIRDIALGERVWPVRAQQVGNAFHNQFELPLLFYILTILAVVAQKDDVLFVVMAWLFAVSRLAHAYVHVTSNYVPFRMQIFAFGAVVLILMWLVFALRILLAF